MKKSIFLPVKKLAVIFTVILAGFVSMGSLHAQTGAAMLTFNFSLTPTYSSTINEPAGTIVVPVYNTANITTLVATFTVSPGATVWVSDVLQTSGIGAKDYTSGVTFQVRSGDGLTTKNYQVTVTKNPIITEKQLLTFYFLGIAGSNGTIDQVNYTVAVTVPYSTVLTNLKAVFTSSPLSTVYIGTALQESGVTENSFTATVVYKVVAENSSVRNYYVTVTKAPASTAKQITSFRFLVPDAIGSINETNHTIAVTVPYSTDVTGLIATFVNSPLSTVKVVSTVQVSGTTQNNFTTPVTYSVIAENLDVQNYVVTVTKAPASSAKDITSFSFAALAPPVTGLIVAQNITLTVPYGTPLTDLVATFTNSSLSTVTIGATPQVSGVTQNNFTLDKVYTVTAQDGTTKNYTVHVAVVEPLHGKAITVFNFLALDPDVIGAISEATNPKTITLLVPWSANVTSLVPTFTNSPESVVSVGGTEQESGTTSQNFTNPVTYICTAQDGTEATYIVTVNKVPASTANSILTFNFEVGFNPIIVGSVNQSAKTISVLVPHSAVLTNLKATFTSSPYSSVTVADVPQVSGVTENNFSVPVVYKCIAEDGSFEFYTVTVTNAPVSTGNKILSFNFEVGFNPAITGVISGNTVTLTVPYSTVVTALKATFTISPYSTLTVAGAPQVSGVTPNDFTSPLEYKCTAEDESIEYYTVTVVKAPVQTGKDILSFRFDGLTPNVVGTINQTTHTIALAVPWSTDVTNLVATFTLSPLANAAIAFIPQTSGVTPNNFTNPVTYTVSSEGGSTQPYVVTVTKVPLSSAKDITDFRFTAIASNPVIGVIDQTARTINVSVPYLTNLTNLVATFTASPLAVVKVGPTVQISGTTVNNFTTTLLYDVTAEDLSTRQYTVTVTIYEMPKQFLTFKFDTYTLIEGDTVKYVANGTINNTTHIIQVNIPFTAPKNNLRAIFTTTANTTVYIGTVVQHSDTTYNDFTSYRSYSLAAADGSTVGYEIRVTNNPVDTQKQITSFVFLGLTPNVVGTINEAAKTINLVVPFGTNKTAMVPFFTTTSNLTRVKVGGVIQKSNFTGNDFTNPVTYRCFDENGNFIEYLVTVTAQIGSNLKDITTFIFQDLDPDVVGAINEVNRTISATVPNGTDRSALRAFYTVSPFATVRVSGVVQQSGITTNDFRIPIIYEVTAQDGTTKSYTVSVGQTPDITPPLVTNAVQTVSNLTGQFVIVRSSEATGKVFIIKNNVTQTTVADLEAAVAAGNGRSAYVTAANTNIPLSTAGLPEGSYYAYAIDAAGNKSLKGVNVMNVTDRLPPTVSMLAQTAKNALNGVIFAQSSEANSLVYIVLEGVSQQSKIQMDAAVLTKQAARALVMSANSDVPLSVSGLVPGNYHAYAVDLSVYNNVSAPSSTVAVITEASRIKSILAFSFEQLDPPAVGQIIGTDISVKVRVGTPVTALVASYIASPLSTVRVGSVVQVNGVTANNFTNPVIYKVTAEDGSSLEYTVTVTFNTGIDQSEWLNDIKAFPNPVSDRLTIESTRPLDRIIILNSIGQTMEDIRNPGQTAVQIPTNSWMKGIYFIRYYSEEKYIGIQKVIKD